MSIDYYNKNSKQFYENTIATDMKALYAEFLQLIKPGDHILDLGCGSGRDSLFFKQNGYQVTALDGSEEMVKLSSRLINQPVLHLRFQEIEFHEAFDAVWACASLLHVNDEEINDVVVRIIRSLKSGGVFYSSFKYGDKEEEREGRYFRYHNEESFEKLIQNHNELEIITMYKTVDARKDREDEYWLNVLLRKK